MKHTVCQDKPIMLHGWRRRFEQYRFASGLSEESGARQCSALLYCLGDASEDILNMSGIADWDRTKYDAVLAKFCLRCHFAITKNLIYERAIFNKRKQEKGESIELYIADVHRLAETCEFGALKSDMIRDRIVVGLQDKTQLQMETDLTLEKAKKLVRQRDAIREQAQR